MKKKSVFTLILILLVAALVGFSVFKVLNSRTVPLLTPKVGIKTGDIVDGNSFNISYFPKNAYIEGLHIPATDLKSQIGKVALNKIEVGEILTYSRLASDKKDGMISNMDSDKNFIIEIPIDEKASVSNISIGSYVSLITSIKTGDDMITTGEIPNNSFKVLNITENGESEVTSISIEVPKEQITQVTYIIHNGTVLVAMNPSKENKVPATPSTDTTIIENFKGTTVPVVPATSDKTQPTSQQKAK